VAYWKEVKKQILSVFLAGNGFQDFQIDNEPYEKTTTSFEGSEYIYGVGIDVKKVKNVPNLKRCWIGIYCKATFSASTQPVSKRNKITVNIFGVKGVQDDAAFKNCRALLIEHAQKIVNFILENFPTI
jgi:hypothetical protein